MDWSPACVASLLRDRSPKILLSKPPSLYIGSILPLTEKRLISRIRGLAARRRGVTAGIGDDCAILQIPVGHQTLVTTDFSLEGVHFRREWHPAEAVGHRCLTRGLSDIAAMGGNAIAAFLSLALPQNLPQAWVDQFMQGLLKLADRFNVSLAGGDTAQSPNGVLADIVVVGSVPKGKAIQRSGARRKDRIYVTGALGGAAATLSLLSSGRNLRPTDFPRHFHPIPRIEVGRFLLEKGLASAMIDLSDGLSTDLGHICEESGVGAEIHAPVIPSASIGKPAREVELHFALNGGDDGRLRLEQPGRRGVEFLRAAHPRPAGAAGEVRARAEVLAVRAQNCCAELRLLVQPFVGVRE